MAAQMNSQIQQSDVPNAPKVDDVGPIVDVLHAFLGNDQFERQSGVDSNVDPNVVPNVDPNVPMGMTLMLVGLSEGLLRGLQGNSLFGMAAGFQFVP